MFNTAEWNQWIQNLSNDSARNLTRLMDTYQGMLKALADGRVSPVGLRDGFSDYVRGQTNAYYEETIRIYFDFVCELLASTAHYSDRLMAGPPDGTGNGDDHLLPAPEKPQLDDWTQWFFVMANYASAQNATTVARFETLLQRVILDGVSPEAVSDYVRSVMETSGPDYFQTLITLSYQLFSRLREMNDRYSAEYFQRVLGEEPSPPPLASRLTTFGVSLSGPPNTLATTTIELSNRSARVTDVCCAISEFRRADGHGESFMPFLLVEPARLRLLPGEKRRVRVSLMLASELFETDHLYSGSLLVKGHDNEDLLVYLDARATYDS